MSNLLEQAIDVRRRRTSRQNHSASASASNSDDVAN